MTRADGAQTHARPGDGGALEGHDGSPTPVRRTPRTDHGTNHEGTPRRRRPNVPGPGQDGIRRPSSHLQRIPRHHEDLQVATDRHARRDPARVGPVPRQQAARAGLQHLSARGVQDRDPARRQRAGGVSRAGEARGHPDHLAWHGRALGPAAATGVGAAAGRGGGYSRRQESCIAASSSSRGASTIATTCGPAPRLGGTSCRIWSCHQLCHHHQKTIRLQSRNLSEIPRNIAYLSKGTAGD